MSMFPYNLKAYAASLGIPQGPHSKVYLVDTEHGVDTNTGTTWETPLKTLLKAEDLCVTNKHDTVLFLARATADNPTAAIVWDKSYTHLIGVGSELYGQGQRCRVVLQSGIAATPMITFSGNGCMVKNMQFNNEKATGAASGVGLVTGLRNYFEKVFFMVPAATDANSYSLKITDGGENVFKDCTIGQHTTVRTGASFSLWIAKGSGEANPTRNKFIHCEFLSWSSATSHVLAKIATDVSVEAFTIQFEDCLFSNINGGNNLAHAIIDGATETHHQIILRGNCMFLGCGDGIADPVTYTFGGITAATAYVGAVAVGN